MKESENKHIRTYGDVAKLIQTEIRSGRFPVGETIPAETCLAAKLGTSRATVRRAIDVLVESGDLTRPRHSRPRVAAGRAAAGLAKNIYVWVIQPMSNSVALQLVKGVSRGLKGSQYSLVVREPSRFEGSVVKAEERHLMIELLKNDDVAGVIVERDPFAEDDDVVAELAARKHLVFVDAPPAIGVNADHVGTSNLSSARACVQHLIDLGHARIACIADTDAPEPIQDRILGYWRAMKLAGLGSQGRVIVACDLPQDGDVEAAMAGEYAQAAMRARIYPGWPIRAVQEVLAMDPRPTALFVCHDSMAFWVAALLEGLGYRVPGDFSVVGFDWIANLDSAIPDILTTAWQDFEGFGRLAADLLLDRLHGETKRGPRQVLLDAPLITRSSTASNLIVPPISAAKGARAEEPTQLS